MTGKGNSIPNSAEQFWLGESRKKGERAGIWMQGVMYIHEDCGIPPCGIFRYGVRCQSAALP